MGKYFSSEFNFFDLDGSDALKEIKSFLCAYFKGGLPANYLTMTESELDKWFANNKRIDIPACLPRFGGLRKISFERAINAVMYDLCDICVKYDDGSDSIITMGGFAEFVFRLLEGRLHNETLFVD